MFFLMASAEKFWLDLSEMAKNHDTQSQFYDIMDIVYYVIRDSKWPTHSQATYCWDDDNKLSLRQFNCLLAYCNHDISMCINCFNDLVFQNNKEDIPSKITKKCIQQQECHVYRFATFYNLWGFYVSKPHFKLFLQDCIQPQSISIVCRDVDLFIWEYVGCFQP